jgi:medium-chain acyl-[acyl-carrier-protein] hydrolase
MNPFQVNPNSPEVFSEQFRIRSYHTDIHRKLTIPKLCSFFQEIAGNHTVACGVGWQVMQTEKVFWVLSRLRIDITMYPVWQEVITIRTWSNGLNGLMAVRHFQVMDAQGKEMIRAVSMWLMVNTETRRLVRPNEYMKEFPLHTLRLYAPDPDKIPELKNPESFPAIQVAFTETDMNMHMNNVSYIDRILNTFEFSFLKEHEMDAFEINFLKEAMPGDYSTRKP